MTKLLSACAVRRSLSQSLALVAGLLVGSTTSTAQMPPPVLTPEKIVMGAFYDGARVRIEGTAPSESGVLVVIRGAEKDEFFNRKGRVGLIWLNADRIHVKQAPSLFLTFSSADVSSLLDRGSLDEYQLDETAIEKRICCFSHCKCSLIAGRVEQCCVHGILPDPLYAEFLLASFVELKEREGCYCSHPRTVSLAAVSGPGTKYTLEFSWPPKAPPGDYQVEVYACHDRKVIARSEATLQLAETGFPAYVANLASLHPWVYGLGAVLVAMLAGFGIDALISRLRRRKRGGRITGGPPGPGTPNSPPEETTIDSREQEHVHHG
jgi:hypothetical protein